MFFFSLFFFRCRCFAGHSLLALRRSPYSARAYTRTKNYINEYTRIYVGLLGLTAGWKAWHVSGSSRDGVKSRRPSEGRPNKNLPSKMNYAHAFGVHARVRVCINVSDVQRAGPCTSVLSWKLTKICIIKRYFMVNSLKSGRQWPNYE